MLSTRRLVLVGGIAALGLLAVPAAADAALYCVPNNTFDPVNCTVEPNIQAALTAAQGTPLVADTVHINAGPYSEANLSYSSTTSTNTVNIVGEGSGATLLTIPNTMGAVTGLSVTAPSGSSVSGLGMTIPANADGNTDTGIALDGVVFGHGLDVEGPAASNDIGVQLTGGASIDTSTINLQFDGSLGNYALRTGGSDGSRVTDMTLHADTGVRHGGAGADTVTIDRTQIQADGAGVSEDSATVNVRNSLINLGANAGAVGVQIANFNNATTPLTAHLDGLTIVGGGSNSSGVQAQADSGVSLGDDGEDTTVSVANTILSGQTHPLLVQADRGETASVSTSYSNYAPPSGNDVTNDLTPGGGTGTAIYSASNQTNLTPGFVSATNFDLSSSSQLIDLGDPAGPPLGDLDIHSQPRAVLGKDGCAARRDIGADEFQPVTPPTLLDCSPPPSGGGGGSGGDTTPPETTIGSHPKAKTKSRKATFTFSSSEAGSTFLCSYDGHAYAACSSPFTTPKLNKGIHRFDVLATDSSGNRDQSAATFFWKIKKHRHHH